MEKEKPRNMRVREAAERLGLRESTIRKMISKRQLAIVRIGRTVTIPEEQIERIVQEGFQSGAGMEHLSSNKS